MELLLRMSLQGAAFIAAVTVLRLVLLHRLPKRTFSALWTLCGIRLLLPVFWESSLSAAALWEALRARMERGAGMKAPDEVFWSEALETIGFGQTAAAAGEAASGGFQPSAGETLWIMGAVLAALYFLSLYLRYRRRFAASLPVSGMEERKVWPGRRVRFRVSDQIDAPLSFGTVRPVVLFPASADRWDGRTAEYVIAHEMAHIRRFDGLRKGMFAAALCLHWWNPAVWLMYVMANRDLELSCDEAVVRRMGCERARDYAMTLIRMEEGRSACAALYSHFSKNAIEERITAIMKIKKTSMIAVAAALCLVVGITAAFAASAPEGKDVSGLAENDSAGKDMTEDDLSGNVPSEDGAVLPEGNASADDAGSQGRDTPAKDADLAGTLRWPGEGCNQLTSAFGARVHPATGETILHDHITMNSSKEDAKGTNVLAAQAGTVTETDYDAKLGNYIVIDHGDGLVTKYAHCQEVFVEEGDPVEQSDAIGTLGATGMVTGPCLGFYVYQDGEACDPQAYF